MTRRGPDLTVRPHPAPEPEVSSIPVLVTPAAIYFTDTPPSYHQVLTIYNPFNVTMQFKVMATSPQFYAVEPASGSILSQSSIKLIIRSKPHTPTLYRERSRDKFQIELQDAARTMRGKSIIPVTYTATPVANSTSTSSTSSTSHREHKSHHSHHANNVLNAATSSSSSSTPESPPSPSITPTPSPYADLFPLFRLFPLLTGVCVIALLASRTITPFDEASTFWICFFVGMITMLVQSKFLDVR